MLHTPDTAVADDDVPVVRLLHKLLADAVGMGASDLHFEPFEHLFRVRLRLDGVLHELAQPPLSLRDKLATRLKILARLDIAEKRLPQDGKMRLALGTRTVDFRVSTLPTQFGEKIVLRILDTAQAALSISDLGYEPAQQEALLQAISKPHGLVLMTGPTGSGKTVSLYACLQRLNQPGVNIATAEDPVEINLPGINQVSINERAGLDFALALRAFLRQDPDVLMVGEIRDLETADIAVKASQTGHLVLSTLHTNDAPATLTRLLNMGVPAYNIAASVSLIVAQRLVRKLCRCRRPAGGTPATFVPHGCPACNQTGFRGRTGIYQVMPVSAAMQSLILAQAGTLELGRQAQAEGIIDLRRAGLLKVLRGETSMGEILACT
ncbi:ATPase, T2SS/T4P/T4SS family [Herbaspirillum huttiense F1]|uniref:ATPase, T2SS/T4P/T4SS family n=1 Tax=Herbaspirillum huttiense subsp. lycopersici TaxID=3074428 RepID=A0ABU2EP48_9BURK|nr:MULTISPECIES: ATPase, T2SS/T4P/T4SS family [Herbaspirillum]MBP1314694.1 type IV pilus assembly protein PilB [Herbaspirillum sp. 1130]MDR6741843.1 type IV pilus assembly protein PilB [Herbaspirillum sp. 1173]MDR9849889.1 ATPase, T2SS/T4P/T4SS family [Herbaspirillum huttiense SE1]MDT0358771.1 ATPase, T2SS/T4P/T4SS family [Herbaspirillum huttiense F1]